MKKLLILVSLLQLCFTSCTPLEGKKVYATNNFCNGADTYFIDFDTKKVVNITWYNHVKLDTS